MGSGQKFATEYAQAVADYFRPLGLVDDSYGITSIKMCQSTLAGYLEIAWQAGHANAIDTPHPAAGPNRSGKKAA